MHFENEELNGLLCRIPFAYGALLINATILIVLLSMIQKRVKSERINRLGILAKWFMILMLLPILIPVILILFIKAGAGAIKHRISTGRWPENAEYQKRRLSQAFRDRFGN